MITMNHTHEDMEGVVHEWKVWGTVYIPRRVAIDDYPEVEVINVVDRDTGVDITDLLTRDERLDLETELYEHALAERREWQQRADEYKEDCRHE